MVCLSVMRQEFVVHDDDGARLFGPFVTAADPVALAQHIADCRRAPVCLELRESEEIVRHHLMPAL